MLGYALIWCFLAESQIYHQPEATPWVKMNSRMAIYALKGQMFVFVCFPTQGVAVGLMI